MKNYTLHFIALSLLMWSCTSETLENPIDCDLEGPQIALDSSTDATCGSSDGSAQLSATAGDGTFTFSSDEFTDDGNGLFINLPAGSHTFTVTDGNSCSSSMDVTIANIDGVAISSITPTDAGCGGSSGTLTITATDGATPYEYKLDNGAYQGSNSFSGLSNKKYTVSVKDANDCEISGSETLTSGISYTNTISPIIVSNCATSGCHNGSQSPSLQTYAEISAKADRILARTANKSMPKGGSLSQTEIDNIACWVNDGSQNN